jgi:hypothetical protein
MKSYSLWAGALLLLLVSAVVTGSGAILTVTMAPSCSYSLSKTIVSLGLSGGTGSVTVTPSASNCAWTAVADASFIGVTAGASGTGTGTVSYSVGSLASGSRIGTLTIAGQTVTVTQSVTIVPTITTINFPGAVSTKAFGINDAGQIVGAYSDGRVEHGFLLSAGVFTTVDYPGAVFTTRAMGINNASQIVGCYYEFDAPGACYKGFLKSGGTFTPIAYPGAFSTNPNGISDSGQIVGTYAFSGAAFRLQGGSFTRIQVPGAADGQTYGSGINNGSAVVGWYNSGNTFGFMLKQGAFSTIVVPGAAITKANGINAAEQIVGDFFIYGSPNRAGGFFLSGGTFSTIELAGITAVNGINNTNQIVGTYGYTGAEHGFVATLAAPTTAPTMSVDRSSLAFSAVSTGAAFTSNTVSQVLRLTQIGAGTASWSASGHYPWLRVSPNSGTGSAMLTVSVQYAEGLAPTQADEVVIFLTSGGGETLPLVRVTLAVVPSAAPAVPPIGSFDTPAGDSAVLAGSVAVTGWALDNMGVKRVEIWRDLQAGETTSAFASTPSDPRNGKVFIGNGTFVDGARPDVEALNSTLPFAFRAGWGYLMLTRGLWNQGNGTYNLYAYAFDQEDNFAILGKKTVLVSNNAATKPFGSIDTPAVGGDASGPNFGWALTPNVNGAGTCKIPPSGVQVSIDSGPLQPVVFGDPRVDVAAAFPGFSNTAAGGGHFIFDWSTLTNGVHTIGWLITDNCNRADGVGSRFFNVTTGTSALTAVPEDFRLKAEATQIGSVASAFRRNEDAVLLARGYGELPAILEPGPGGSRTIEMRQAERIEVRLPRGYDAAYQDGPDDQRRALPAGSTWDAASGTFYWQPAAGFLGRFRLVFTNGSERISVRVVVMP